MTNPIVKRYKGNPILTKKDIPYPVYTVHNAGVAKHNGVYYMLFRSHLDTGRSIIGLAESNDGYKFKVHDKPFIIPSKDGLFSIEVVACIGACGLAPVIAVNGNFHAKVTTESLKEIIESYK